MVLGLESSSLGESLFYIIGGLVILLDIFVLIFILKRLVFSERGMEKRVTRVKRGKTAKKEVVKVVKEKGIDKETKEVLKITDELLAKLPDDVIKDFVKSKDFELYKKVMEKVGK